MNSGLTQIIGITEQSELTFFMGLTHWLGLIASGSSVTPITASLVGWHEATSSTSYSGSGTTLTSLVTVPADTTSQAANLINTSGSPTFTGSAGSQSAYFLMNGSSFLTQAAATLTSTSMLLNAHRSDLTTGFWVAWAGVIPADNTAVRIICGPARFNSGSDVGYNLSLSATGGLQLQARNGTTSAVYAGPGVPRGVPVLIVASWNGSQSTNNVRFWVNTTTKWVVGGAFPTATVAATLAHKVCGNTLQLMTSGTQFKSFLYGNSFIDDGQVSQIYALLLAQQGIDYTGGGPLSASRALEVSLIGDSGPFLNEMNTQGTATDAGTNNQGWFTNYNNLANHRMNYPYINILGISGQNSTQVLARSLTDPLGKFFDVIWNQEGSNDCSQFAGYPGSSTATSVITNIGSILDNLVYTLGKPVIQCTIVPRSAWGSFTAPQIAAAKADIITINTWIKSQDGSRGGKVIVVDLYSVLDDGTGTPLANTLIDGAHLSPYGGMLCGQYLKTYLGAKIGNFSTPTYSTGNLLTNGTLSGTGGTTSGVGVTGVVATSFGLTFTGGTTAIGTVVGSKPSANVQQIVLTWGTGGTANVSAQLSQAITTGFAIGDTVYGSMLVELDTVTPVNILEGMLNVVLTGTGISGRTDVRGMSMWTTFDNSFTGFSYVPVPVAETYISPGIYLVQTPDIYIAAGTGLTLTATANLTGLTSGGAAASGTMQISGIGIFKR